MSRLPILALATALLPAGLAAQTVSPPVAWEDTPSVRLNTPATAAAGSVQGRAPTALPPAPVAVPPPLPVAARPAPVAVPPVSVAAARPVPPVAAAPLIAARPAAAVQPPVAGPAPRVQPVAADYPRMARGQRVGGVWAGPRAEVRNYGDYGLYPPAGGNRWVRYHDDALLVDDGGVVRDTRSGLDWDQYGDWAEEDGVPVYVGRGDYQPDEQDYAYVEEQARGAERAYANNERYERRFEQPYEDAGYRGGYPPSTATVTYRCDGYAEPGSPCGPGWDYPPGTVITETIVTTPPVTTAHTYYVERVVGTRYRAKAKRLYRHRENCDCSAPGRCSRRRSPFPMAKRARA